MMRRYAQEHPQLAAYVSITESVCHAPISSPCDDTVDGFSARPQGQHFEGPGATVAVDALLAGVAPLIRRLGKPLPSAVADA